MYLAHAAVAWPGVYDAISPYLERAMAEGMADDWSMAQVLHMLTTEQWRAYGAFDADHQCIGAGVTCVQVTGKRRILEVLMFSSEPNHFPHEELMPQLKEIAAQLGCHAIQAQGRKGWLRALDGAKALNKFEIEV